MDTENIVALFTTLGTLITSFAAFGLQGLFYCIISIAFLGIIYFVFKRLDQNLVNLNANITEMNLQNQKSNILETQMLTTQQEHTNILNRIDIRTQNCPKILELSNLKKTSEKK